MKFYLKPIASCVFSTLSVGLLVSCGGGSDSTPMQSTDEETTPITAPASIVDQLRTEFSDSSHQGWACLDEAGEASVFTFYEKGRIAGIENLQLGSEYSIRSEVEPFHYNWVAIDNTSITLRSQPRGLEDVWTNVEFSDDNDSPDRVMRAISGSRGQLYCSFGERK